MGELAAGFNQAGRTDLPTSIKTPALRSLYNNLGKDEQMALQIDEAIKRVKQVDFRGDERKENLIKYEIYLLLKDEKEVERIFSIIKEQKDY
jgi:type I restriction enzyme R subunit